MTASSPLARGRGSTARGRRSASPGPAPAPRREAREHQAGRAPCTRATRAHDRPARLPFGAVARNRADSRGERARAAPRRRGHPATPVRACGCAPVPPLTAQRRAAAIHPGSQRCCLHAQQPASQQPARSLLLEPYYIYMYLRASSTSRRYLLQLVDSGLGVDHYLPSYMY